MPMIWSQQRPLRDRYFRRGGEDYFQQLLGLLPWGQAWPREPGGTLWRAVRGLAIYWGFIDGRAGDLLERESDPRKTIELLPDWERAWGLPDPCFPEATTLGERQKMLITKMTWMGGQSRDYFTRLMQWLGFGIDIKEFAPFMAGVSEAGDTRPRPEQNFRWYIGPPEMRFAWSAHAGKMGLVWFRAGSGQAGVDTHLQMRPAQDLQCLLNRWKPSHTALVMDFSELAFGDSMEGTP